jgi:hypothetical protein
MRKIELHPDLVDTRLGELLMRADMLVWPLLNNRESTYTGTPVPETDAVTALRRVFERELDENVRQNRVNPSSGAVSNINDVSARASFCVIDGRVGFAGDPGIDVLWTAMTGNATVVLTTTSALLREQQSTMVRRVDPAAYDAALRSFRLVGLMTYVKNSNPTAWTALMRTLPPNQHFARTPRIVCPRCDPDQLMNWIAAHATTR